MESWTKYEKDLALEMTRNGISYEDGETFMLIDWERWAKLDNITPEQAARLVHYIDPNTWPGNDYKHGPIPEQLSKDIRFLAQALDSKKAKWTLAELVNEIGDTAPWGMVEAVKGGQLAVKNSNRPSEYEKRLVALNQWMSENDFEKGCQLPKRFTIETVYSELCKFDGNLFCSFELSSFKRHFWSKQKLCKLTRGRKDGVV
ncbi:MAG TPA: hypothetical protein DCZ48_13935 [Methylococcaceae bacterium]|nr:hypothetical protein [Methylococcaceae bacterium]